MRRRELAALAVVALLLVASRAYAGQATGNEIIVQFTTGGDDLRGGSDNVDLFVLLRSGTPLRFETVNERKTWGNNSSVTVRRPLPATVRVEDIVGVRVGTTASGAMGGDNWNLDRLAVSVRIGSATRNLYDQQGAPLVRFTGDNRIRDFRFTVAQVFPRAAPPVMTRFNPKAHGFKFANEFKNIFISQIDWTTGGLCGGMSYAALDYFRASRPVPEQTHMPAEGMPLQRYIYNRQVNSIAPNVDKWGEYGFNPGGRRNREFFNWGLQTGSGRLGELTARIDRGEPVPLGLQGCGDDCRCPGGCPGNHQVLAIGYEMGHYAGNLGDHMEDVSIFVYDPNSPNAMRTLKPDVAGAHYYYRENAGKRWRAYFVDTKYSSSVPPTISASPSELQVEFVTGGDDLRGGNDNVNLFLLLRSGEPLRFPNVNGGKRWINGSSQTVALPLPDSVRPDDIIGVRLETTFGGGMGSDNWNLERLVVRARVGGTLASILAQGGTPLFRFTGSQRVREFRR